MQVQQMQQKLVTIPLYDDNEEDMEVKEHLEDYFINDWRIAQMVPVGSGVGTGDEESGGYVAGWLAVLLERPPI